MKTERDMGAMISFEQRQKDHHFKYLKIDAGLFNGPGLSASADYDSHKDFEERNKKIATPIGWVRYKGGYGHDDRLTFRLYEALRGIKDRERGVSIDGIYTVLGLLAYGEQVDVKYEEWGHEYTMQELQKALVKVMKTAIEFNDKVYTVSRINKALA